MFYLFFIFALMANDCGSPSAEWSQCSQKRDCAGFVNACGHKTPYNKRFLGEISRYNKCMGPKISCPTLPALAAKDIQSLECIENKCQMLLAKKKETKAESELPRRCSTDDQCTLVFITQCCSPDAINIKYKANYEKKIKDKVAECATVNCIMVESKAACNDQKCEAVRK